MEKYMDWIFTLDEKARTLIFECYTYGLDEIDGRIEASHISTDTVELEYFGASQVWELFEDCPDFYRSYIREHCADIVRITDISLWDADDEIIDLAAKYTPSELLGELSWID